MPTKKHRKHKKIKQPNLNLNPLDTSLRKESSDSKSPRVLANVETRLSTETSENTSPNVLPDIDQFQHARSIKKYIDLANKVNWPFIKQIASHGIAYLLTHNKDLPTHTGGIITLTDDQMYDAIQGSLYSLLDKLGQLTAPIVANTAYKIARDFLTLTSKKDRDNVFLAYVVLLNLTLRITGKSPELNKGLDHLLTFYNGAQFLESLLVFTTQNNLKEQIYFFTGNHPYGFRESADSSLPIDFFSSENLDYTFIKGKDQQKNTLFTTKFDNHLGNLGSWLQRPVGYLSGKWCKNEHNDKWVFAVPSSKKDLIMACNKYNQTNRNVDTLSAVSTFGNEYPIHYYYLKNTPHSPKVALGTYNEAKQASKDRDKAVTRVKNDFQNVFWEKEWKKSRRAVSIGWLPA